MIRDKIEQVKVGLMTENQEPSLSSGTNTSSGTCWEITEFF